MAEEVDRNKVFETTRVKTSLKNDVSWIQGSKQGHKEQDSARTAQAVETKPASVKEKSYVLLTAKKFESVNPPPSPPLQNTEFILSEGDSANQENCEVVPPHKDAQPEGSTVETTDDARSQAVTEKPIQNGDAQPDTSVENTTAENKEENADTAVKLSNVEQNEGAAEVSADVHVEEQIQNGEAQPDTSVENTTAENKEENADTAVELSNVEQNEGAAEVSADVHVDEQIQNGEAQPDTSVENTTAENKEENADTAVELSNVEQNEGAAEVSADVHVDEQIQNGEAQPDTSVENTTAENKEENADTTIELSNAGLSEGTAEVSADVHVDEQIQNGEAQPDTSVENTSVENKEENADTTIELSNAGLSEGTAEVSADVHVEEHVQHGEAQPVSSSKEEPESVSPAEPTEQQLVNTTSEIKGEYANTAADESYVEQNEVKVSADARVEDAFAETSAAAGTGENKDSAVVPAVLLGEPKIEDQPSAETEPANATNVENAGVESTVEPAEGSSETCPPKEAAGEIVKAIYVAVEESSPDESDVINTASGGEAVPQDSVDTVPDVVASRVSESPTHPAAEAATDRGCETGPSADTAEAAIEVKVESLPAPLAPANAAGDEAAPQDTVKAVPDLVADTESKSPTQPAAEAAVESVDSQVVSAASAEPILQTRADEVVKCEVQPVQSAVVEQSAQPATDNASDQVVELSIMDALEPVTAPNDQFSYDAMELTDALDVDVKPPTSDAAPEPAKDPEQSHTEEKPPIQQSDLTNIFEMSQKSEEEQRPTRTLSLPRTTKAVCSFCDKTIDGNVRLIFSEPQMNCHPDCLKCGVCAKALGDLLTPMFLCNQVIQCDGCFAIALKT
ncbi:zinc finger protein 185 [Sparus aurata]|uniref:zinc finger protein 185 n=1 Tax=Sparus aurata TaxID=8175 RepID=UPI0011C132B8|nr:zinc finger protein 185-like [Sparus aurata]